LLATAPTFSQHTKPSRLKTQKSKFQKQKTKRRETLAGGV